jgi:hypothetical protein
MILNDIGVVKVILVALIAAAVVTSRYSLSFLIYALPAPTPEKVISTSN